MAFWSRKQPQTQNGGVGNRFGPSLLAGLAKGAKINDVARQLRGMTTSKLEGSDVVAALQTALGYEIAAFAIGQNSSGLGPDSLRYILDQLLDATPQGVREAAYEAANLPDPEPYGDRALTDQEFSELTNRIVNAATQGNVPVDDSLTATAKALGAILCILSERPGVDREGLIAFTQDAVGQFAKEAAAFRERNR